MTGRQLLAALELYGFTVVRRSKTCVWLARGNDVLMLDHEGTVDDHVAEQILERARDGSTQS